MTDPRAQASALLTDEKLDYLIDLAGGFHGEADRIRVGVLNLLQPLFTKLTQAEAARDMYAQEVARLMAQTGA